MDGEKQRYEIDVVGGAPIGVILHVPGVPSQVEVAGVDVLAIGDLLGAGVGHDLEHVGAGHSAGDDGGGGVRAVAAPTVASGWRGRGSRHGGQQRRAWRASIGWVGGGAGGGELGGFCCSTFLPFLEPRKQFGS